MTNPVDGLCLERVVLRDGEGHLLAAAALAEEGERGISIMRKALDDRAYLDIERAHTLRAGSS